MNIMTDGQAYECCPKFGSSSSKNHSQVRHSTNKSTCINEQDNSLEKTSLKLTWTIDFLLLKSFVCNTMKLQGDWTQPGGDKKVFIGKSFRITWRKGKN